MASRFVHPGLAFASLALVAACSPEAPVEEAPPSEPVVVYTAYDDKTYLPTLFNEFTQDTGIIVIVRNGSVPGIVDDVIGDRVTPRADMLITPSRCRYSVPGCSASGQGHCRPVLPPWISLSRRS